VADLDSLPFPDKELFYGEYGGWRGTYSIISGRGCLYRCSFCCHSFLKQAYHGKGPYLRRRSVDNVIEELKSIKRANRIKNIFFCDDLFLYDVDWIREFSNKYKKDIDLPFACEAHPAHVSEEIVGLIDAAGCVTVGMGIQMIDQNERETLLHRFETNSQVMSAIDIFQRSKIFLCTDMLIAVPAQDEKALIDSAEFFNEHKPDFIFPFWLRYYPQTKISEIAHQRGVLSNSDLKTIQSSKDFAPFRCNPFDRRISRLTNLMLISHLLPRRILKKVIEKKIYRWFPAWDVLSMQLVALLTALNKRILSGKKRLVFSTANQIGFYLYYGMKKITGSAK
jgi:radical SAM superfamily enzyme YgiQ (UPF0313 family)